MSRKKKENRVQSNVSPRKLAFPIHFASCWINDDWVHDSDFHYSQSTLTLETFVSSFYEATKLLPQLDRHRYRHPRDNVSSIVVVLKKYPICNLSRVRKVEKEESFSSIQQVNHRSKKFAERINIFNPPSRISVLVAKKPWYTQTRAHASVHHRRR